MFIDDSKEGQKTAKRREATGLQTGRRNGQQTGCNKSSERRPKAEREGETEVEKIGGRLVANKHANFKIIVGSKQDLKKKNTERQMN